MLQFAFIPKFWALVEFLNPEHLVNSDVSKYYLYNLEVASLKPFLYFQMYFMCSEEVEVAVPVVDVQHLTPRLVDTSNVTGKKMSNT